MSNSTSDNDQNMELWNLLCKTPEEYAQPSRITQSDGTRLTIVKSQYRIQKLTEVFGPIGVGWGYDIIERWTDTWGSVNCAYVRLKVWYEWKECKYFTGEQIGGTIVGENPDNVWKSTITDAIAKCASMIGLCSDAYMGEFDNQSTGGPQASKTPIVKQDPQFGKPEEKPSTTAPDQNLKQERSECGTANLTQAQKETQKTATEEPAQKIVGPSSSTQASANLVCPTCQSTTSIAKGRCGKPHFCFDCNTKFNDSGLIVE